MQFQNSIRQSTAAAGQKPEYLKLDNSVSNMSWYDAKCTVVPPEHQLQGQICSPGNSPPSKNPGTFLRTNSSAPVGKPNTGPQGERL
jgi:hypothetical protein